MNRPVLILAGILTICLCVQSRGQETSGSGTLAYRSWAIPPALVTRADSRGGRKIMPGFKGEPGARRFDAGEFIAAFGILSPEGTEASFDTESARLVVRNSPENLELLEIAFAHCGIANTLSSLAVDLSVYRCALPSAPLPDASKWPAFADLQKLPEKDFKLVSQVSAVTKSGERTLLKAIKGSGGNAKDQPKEAQTTDSQTIFHTGESGVVATFSPVASANQSAFDGTLEFGWRSPTANSQEETIKFSTTFIASEGLPIVIYLAPSRDEPGMFNVVIVTIRVTAHGAWNFETFKAAGEEAKIFKKQPGAMPAPPH